MAIGYLIGYLVAISWKSVLNGSAYDIVYVGRKEQKGGASLVETIWISNIFVTDNPMSKADASQIFGRGWSSIITRHPM